MKVDVEVLEKFSDEKTVKKFNKEIELFLAGKTENVSREAVSYFYLTLHKMENKELTPNDCFYARLRYDDIRSLEGKMLTILDASIGETRQNKAIKDIVRRAIWFDWSNTLDKTYPPMDSGIPHLESYGVIN